MSNVSHMRSSSKDSTQGHVYQVETQAQDTSLGDIFILIIHVKLVCLYLCIISKCEFKSFLCVAFTKIIDFFIILWFVDKCAFKILKKNEG